MSKLPRIIIALTIIIGLSICAQSAPQKKKKKAATPNSPPTVKLETVTPSKTDAAKTDAPTPEKEPLHAEKNPRLEAWRINVEPYAILGSGRPGKGAADIDKPDGVAFAPNGWLFATDAKNHRVQIWDVKTKTRLGEFGHGIFGGEIVDIATAPNGDVLVTDQTLNLAYAFSPPKPGAVGEKGKPLGPYDYQFKGTRFGEQGFDKLGGIMIDSRGRIYAVDAHLNTVRRFNADGTVDGSWNFEKAMANGDTYLHGCEGIAIDETNKSLFIASEKDAVIQVFDSESGAYKGKLLGAGKDATGKPAGARIFSGSVEGLTIAGKHLFAVDESVGHIQVFDISQVGAFNTDLSAFAGRRGRGYMGFFGHSPQVDFEDKNNKVLQQQVKDGAIIPGQANPPGYFCSPDSITSYTDKAGNETYIAIADQCNFRLAVYRWSDISKSMSPAVAAVSNKNEDAAEETTKEGKDGKGGKGGKGGKKKGKKNNK